MSKGAYVGVSGVARKIAGMYVGVGGVARKVVAGYVGVDGVARQFYVSGPAYTITYSGTYNDANVVIDGVTRRLLTLTGSGTLNVVGDVTADIWITGAGGKGGDGHYISQYKKLGGGGGGGGHVASLNDQSLSGNYTVIVGAATTSVGGTTSIVGTLLNLSAQGGENGGTPTGTAVGNGGDGGSSGGAGSKGSAGIADGASTIPFGANSIFTPHSAGGGGAAAYNNGWTGFYFDGGNGGTNGGAGEGSEAGQAGGSGGNQGGGNGGATSGIIGSAGTNATFYGGGGGGSGANNTSAYDGAMGYQGVVYILI